MMGAIYKGRRDEETFDERVQIVGEIRSHDGETRPDSEIRCLQQTNP